MTLREEKSDWFTDGATAAQLNSIGHTVYSAAGTHTHTQAHTDTHSAADERKGLFLDPCIVSEIAKELSEQSRFHFRCKERVLGEQRLVGSCLN